MYRQIENSPNQTYFYHISNDGEYVDGCIAGGRRYCHINANGDIEPCAFIHILIQTYIPTPCLRHISHRFSGIQEESAFNCNMLGRAHCDNPITGGDGC